MICWGIDPGVSGAICCFDYTEGAVDIFDMPIVEVRGKKEVSPVLVRNILRDLPGPVFVERVGARPGQGVSHPCSTLVKAMEWCWASLLH